MRESGVARSVDGERRTLNHETDEGRWWQCVMGLLLVEAGKGRTVMTRPGVGDMHV